MHHEHDRACRVIAIGASTGGTDAILHLLKGLPREFPGIVIVQHMPASFTTLYAKRLNDNLPFPVREAVDGDPVRPCEALLAPGGYQLTLAHAGSGFVVRVQPGPKVSGHCPSVDVLFDSVAHVARAQSIGVILTGMGADGAHGLLHMRHAGAQTFGQDEASCVVYGMPMEAMKLGAVKVQLPLAGIAGAISGCLRKGME